MENNKTRVSKWTKVPYIHKMKLAVMLYRIGVATPAFIDTVYNIPGRSLRRYVAKSRDPQNMFYIPPTKAERISSNVQILANDLSRKPIKDHHTLSV